jgi:FAD-dependent oxidoreductase domain-containing protein 1
MGPGVRRITRVFRARRPSTLAVVPDVIIVGGAANGWATAYHLLRLDPSLTVIVVEKDPTLRYSSTMLSDGNVRIQFNLEENIRISRYAMEVLEDFAETMAVGDFRPDPKLRKQGNLFLVDETGKDAALAGLATQQRLGCDSMWLDMADIASRWPALASETLIGGTFGPSDGSVDPAAVVEGYRRKSLEMGATSHVGEVVSLTVDGGKVTGVTLAGGATLAGDVVVVAAGAWSAALLQTVGVDLPVDPVMRTVYVVRAAVEGGASLPSVFLPSGVYAIPEHDTFFMAWSTDDDPVGFDFTPAPRDRFYETIWPELVTHLPAFDRLEVVRSWAGLYAQNRLDANAILGEWPGVAGLYMATGFSGHGFQQCHAVGRYLAELITGTDPALDLSRFGPERIIRGEPYAEHAGRII